MKPKNHRAVAADRREPRNSRDFFPSPPWSVRAVIKFVLARHLRPHMTAYDPACGQGHLAEPLREYFATVYSSDVVDYGYGGVADFLDEGTWQDCSYVFTNPPFNLAIPFIERSLEMASHGVAILCHTRTVEGITRYERLFRDRPPTVVAPFVERCSIIRGRWDPDARSATAFCWLVWVHAAKRRRPELIWIPPGQKAALTTAADLKRFARRSP